MRKLLLALTMMLGAPVAHAHEPESEGSKAREDVWTVIHAGVLIARPGEAPLREQSIIVRNDRIERVVTGYVDADDAAVGGPAKVIDLTGAYILPGLIDVHVHLGLGGDRDKGRTAETGDEAFRMLNVIDNAKKTLDAGFTTVRDVGGEGWGVLAFRDGVREGVFPGPRVFAAGYIIHIGTFEGDGPGACHDAASCKKAVRRQIEMGADWIKIRATCSGSKPCGHEHAPGQFLADELDVIVSTAATHDVPVAAHAHSTAGINDALRAGVRSIEHGSYNDRTSRGLFKEQNSFYVPTLAVRDVIQKDYETATPEMKPVMEGFLKSHPESVRAAHEAGVKIAAGSDAGVISHGDNARELYWYVETGMSEAETLRAATIVNAELLGKENDLGSVEAGKFADIIAVSRNPLADIEALADVAFVMAGGAIVKSSPASVTPNH